MTETFYGCHYTNVWVSPKDWKTTTSKASLKKDWYVQCYFFDPLFKDKYPRGRTYRKKLNKLKTLDDRKAAVEYYLQEIPLLFKEGYNHITEKYMIGKQDQVTDLNKLSPATPSAEAIEKVWVKILDEAKESAKKSDIDNPKPFDDVRVAKNRFITGLKALKHDDTPIKDLSVSDIKETIVYLKITDGYYNKFLSYMSKLYTELIEYGCVENNPFKLYKKKKIAQKKREVLSEQEYKGIKKYLYNNHYGFYRYGEIFHHSGGRSTELMKLQKKDVDLENQEYKVLIKKGGQYTIETKVILLDIIDLWKEILSECKSENDYVFSEGFKPGPKSIAARQVSRKWNKYIKKRYNEIHNTNITADFYALKHLFLDKIDAHNHKQLEVVSSVPDNMAQILASHTTSKITDSVYLQNKKKRDRDSLKKVKIAAEQ